MRTNDKVLLENINDYFSHKGMAPNLIDDIKENLRNDLKKSESKDEDYLDYRGKSPAQIILIIQRNLFGLQTNPVIFFIMNFHIISIVQVNSFFFANNFRDMHNQIQKCMPE